MFVRVCWLICWPLMRDKQTDCKRIANPNPTPGGVQISHLIPRISLFPLHIYNTYCLDRSVVPPSIQYSHATPPADSKKSQKSIRDKRICKCSLAGLLFEWLAVFLKVNLIKKVRAKHSTHSEILHRMRLCFDSHIRPVTSYYLYLYFRFLTHLGNATP